MIDRVGAGALPVSLIADAPAPLATASHAPSTEHPGPHRRCTKDSHFVPSLLGFPVEDRRTDGILAARDRRPHVATFHNADGSGWPGAHGRHASV